MLGVTLDTHSDPVLSHVRLIVFSGNYVEEFIDSEV